MPVLLKFFQEIAEEGTLPNSFYEATIILISKADKDTTKRINSQAHITGEQSCKNSQQNTSKLNQLYIKRIMHPDQVGFIPRL